MAAAFPGVTLRRCLFGCALAVLSPALSVLAEEGRGAPSGGPRFFDFNSTLGAVRPGMPFPPTVVGPGGVIRPLAPRAEAKRLPSRAPTAAERAARIRKALAPRPPLALVRRRTLDDLYGKLASARDHDEAEGLATLITRIWLRSGSDTADLLMQRSMQSIEKKDFKVALDLLNRLVVLHPGWAEAWNKRASVRFYTGDLNGAMADVERVLRLEPKHFGALDGMGSILQRTGFEKRALEVFRRSLAIYPHQPDVEKLVEKLQLDVEGQGI
jgi:tetratricopeptide (TPR) repeat protein